MYHYFLFSSYIHSLLSYLERCSQTNRTNYRVPLSIIFSVLIYLILFRLKHTDTILHDNAHNSSQITCTQQQAMQQLLLFQSEITWGPHVLLQCTVVNMRFLPIIFKDGKGYGLLWITDISQTQGSLYVKFCW